MSNLDIHSEVEYIAPGAGTVYHIRSDTMTVKVPGGATGGAYAVLEVQAAPLSGPPQMHRHVAQESFYVLEGDFAVLTVRGGHVETIPAPAGALVLVPGGIPHNYKNVGTSPGRFLATFTPAGIEGFFAEMSVALALGSPGGAVDMRRLGAIAEKYGIAMVSTAE
jgi:mannose-6-phosphate isomerase-like protein (cupin superfamily)